MGRLARLLKRSLVLGAIGVAVANAALYLAPLPAPPAASPPPEAVKILDREGRLLYDSAGPGDVHYTYVPLQEMPERLKHAVVATEDASFYSNPGIDLRAIARAALTDLRLREARQGGSTITQQLARNLYFAPEERSSASPLRKISEVALALRLDRSMSKDEILEQYLNRVYLGNLAYGAEAASRTYFGKSVRDLDLAESALLAGLPQSPADYDPFTQIEAARFRQRTVLARMVDEGYLTAAEAEAASVEPLALNKTPFPMRAPHFVAWVREQLQRLVGEEALARGGLRVYTSLDLDLQQSAQAAVAWHVGELKDRNVTDGASVAIHPAALSNRSSPPPRSKTGSRRPRRCSTCRRHSPTVTASPTRRTTMIPPSTASCRCGKRSPLPTTCLPCGCWPASALSGPSRSAGASALHRSATRLGMTSHSRSAAAR